MSATPPPPSGTPPPDDEDQSLEEIDCLSGKEKFRALQKRLSSSSTMYSSAVSSPNTISPSPPLAASPAPPPKKPHIDEEIEASKNAKKLTHATKDRPRRKVRLPSRELRRENLEKLDPPVRPPLPIEMMEASESELLPPTPDSSPPPPPDSAPPHTSTPVTNSGKLLLYTHW